MLLDKIERVARVKGVDNDVTKRFDRKRGYKDESGSKKRFSQSLQTAIDKDAVDVQISTNAAVSLDLSRTATHSLFYQSGLSLYQLIENAAS